MLNISTDTKCKKPKRAERRVCVALYYTCWI